MEWQLVKIANLNLVLGEKLGKGDGEMAFNTLEDFWMMDDPHQFNVYTWSNLLSTKVFF